MKTVSDGFRTGPDRAGAKEKILRDTRTCELLATGSIYKHKHHKNVLRGVQGIKKAPSWEGAYCVCVLVMLVRLPLELRCGYADCDHSLAERIAVPMIVVVAVGFGVPILDAAIAITVVFTETVFNRAERRASAVRAFMR